jgi:diguanylate cyclase
MTAILDRHLQTFASAKFAIEQIERFSLPADPQSFELWYIYATGHNQPLNKALDAMLTAGCFSETELDRLCTLYISSSRSATRLNSVATKLTDEVAQVIGMIDAATGSSQEYDQHLGEGLEVLERTNHHEALKPVVEALVSATREMEDKTRALEVQLEASKSKTTELQQDIETIRLESSTDALTLIGNRQYFDEKLLTMTAVAKETGRPLALLFADVDHFKNFNDTFGHQVGDQVLRLVAAAINESIREGCFACRYGGEEFAVILPDTPLASAKMAAERIRVAVQARDLKKRSTQSSLGRVTISIGVARLHSKETPHEFLQRADACLYVAKRSGRNRVVSEHDSEYTADDKLLEQLADAS